MGLPSLVLGALFWVNNQLWYYWLVTLLFAAWAALGYTVDIWRPGNWRAPLRRSIFMPYLILYLAAQFAFSIPLWFIGAGYWVSYTILHVLNKALNIPSHFGSQGTKTA